MFSIRMWQVVKSWSEDHSTKWEVVSTAWKQKEALMLAGLNAGEEYPNFHEVGEAHQEGKRFVWTSVRWNKVPVDDIFVKKLTSIYGPSYFGSGGGRGNVECGENCTPVVETLDNGFMAGPAGVAVIDPTRPASFRAGGGDAIGGGRRWSESGEWIPGTGWK